MNAFNLEIMRAMSAAGVSRAELARRLGVSRAAVTMLLARDNIGEEMIGRVAAVLGVRARLSIGDTK